MEPMEEGVPPEPPRQAAVMFAELIGAAELYASAGDEAAHATITPCLDALQEAAALAGARVVKRIGGRLMLLASSADTGARSAVALQCIKAHEAAIGRLVQRIVVQQMLRHGNRCRIVTLPLMQQKQTLQCLQKFFA